MKLDMPEKLTSEGEKIVAQSGSKFQQRIEHMRNAEKQLRALLATYETFKDADKYKLEAKSERQRIGVLFADAVARESAAKATEENTLALEKTTLAAAALLKSDMEKFDTTVEAADAKIAGDMARLVSMRREFENESENSIKAMRESGRILDARISEFQALVTGRELVAGHTAAPWTPRAAPF